MKYTLLVFLFLMNVSMFAQTFEGNITYRCTYISSEELNIMMGTHQYFVKDNKYKTIMNGSFSEMQLYVPTENRLYNQLSITDTLIWSNGSNNSNKAVSYELKKDQAEILGYNCDALVWVLKWETTYYFSNNIKVDPKLYEDHKYGNWALLTGQILASKD